MRSHPKHPLRGGAASSGSGAGLAALGAVSSGILSAMNPEALPLGTWDQNARAKDAGSPAAPEDRSWTGHVVETIPAGDDMGKGLERTVVGGLAGTARPQQLPARLQRRAPAPLSKSSSHPNMYRGQSNSQGRWSGGQGATAVAGSSGAGHERLMPCARRVMLDAVSLSYCLARPSEW
jgi:hypothetical protein